MRAKKMKREVANENQQESTHSGVGLAGISSPNSDGTP